MNSLQQQIFALKEYIACLQKENNTKNNERQVVYRELESMQAELGQMERYYQMKVELQKRLEELRGQFGIKMQECQHIIVELQNQKHFFIGRLQETESGFITKQQILQEMEAKLDLFASSHLEAQRTLQQTQQKLRLELSKNECLLEENAKLQENFSMSQEMIYKLQKQVGDYEASDMRNMQSMEKNIQFIVRNYEKVEGAVVERDQEIRELSNYINDLEFQCQDMNNELVRKEDEVQELEAIIANLHQKIEMKQMVRDMEYANSEDMLDSIPKIDLIKHSNHMVERINHLEKENNSAYINRCDTERFIKSEFDCKHKNINNSASKLKLRIQALKMENENLLRNLI